MRGETVILAAGDFPRKGGEAWRLLAGAKRVICCDGAAAAYRRRMGREPLAIVGDLDSLGDAGRAGGAKVVRIAEQETNDLAKAVRWCREQGWRKPLILGATGRREDHALGNIFRALDFGLEIVTDYGRFIPVEGRVRLTVRAGAPVSVFAPDPTTRMTSKGLAWPLDGIRFDNLFCATLNRATARTVQLTTTRRALVYLSERTDERRSAKSAGER